MLDFSKHPLLASTLFDNCEAMHLVNSKDILDEGSFVKVAINEYVKARTLSFPIIEQGTRTIKNVINREDKAYTKDLILIDVVVVDNFYVNIISKA